MKKAIIMILGVIVAFATIAAASKSCPSQNPWLQLPICEGRIKIPKFPKPTPSVENTSKKEVAEASTSEIEKPALEVIPPPAPETKLSVSEPDETITVSLMVTVPHWTTGHVYLGIDNNPTYLKLEKVNSVTYKGTAKLEKGKEYYYSRGFLDTISINTFKSSFPESLDAVIDWKDSSRNVRMSGFQQGVTLGGSHWRKDEYKNLNWAIDKAKEYGVTHILIIPNAWLYPDRKGNELKTVYFEDPLYTVDPRFNTAQWGWWGASLSDSQVKEITAKTKSRGMKLVLKPHIDVWDGTSRGAIEPSDATAFFSNYNAYITRYAELAEELDVDLFIIGTELDSVAHTDGLLAKRGMDITAEWKKIIQNVRKSYSGKISYSVACFGDWKSCNPNDLCRGPSMVGFWGDLDYIGFEPYFGVTQKNSPSLAELKNGFVEKFDRWAKPLYEKYGKKILLTEVNTYSFDGVNTDPIAMFTNPESHPIDKQEQADYYEAIYQSVAELPYIKGSYPWPFWLYMGEKTEYDRIQWSKNHHRDSLVGVLAGQVLKKWYNKIED